MQKKPQRQVAKQQLRHDLYLKLVGNPELWSENKLTALEIITETTSRVFNVHRVSIWSMKEAGRLVCDDLYDSKKKTHDSGSELLKSDYPKYFDALDQNRVIDAHDAHTDPRTSEFSLNYLAPLGIGAMLDATIRTAGNTNGVICIEHIGGPRLWSTEDKDMVLTLADVTAQVEVYHDLQNTVSRYEGLLANMPSAAYRCLYDKDWTMRYISPGIEHITGYPANDFIDNENRSYASIIHPNDAADINETIEHAIETEGMFNVEYRIERANGEVRWLNETGRLVEANEKVFIDGVINDITDNKNASELEHKLENIISNISQGIASETGDVFFKKLTSELAGVLEVDFAFIGEYHDNNTRKVNTLSVYAHGEHQPDFSYELKDTPCDNVLDAGICCYPAHVQKLFPNDHLLVEMGIEGYLGAPLLGQNGKILGIMVVLHQNELKNTELATEVLNIFAVRASTELERQLSEQALNESQQHYKSLFEAAGDAIFVVQNGVITDCNTQTLEMFGCSRQEIINHSPIDFSPEIQPDGTNSRDIVVDKISAVLEGEPQNFEWQHCRRDGTVFYSEVSLNSVGGKKTQILAIVRDISERKRNEEMIHNRDKQLRASIEAMPGIYYMFDAEGYLTYANQAYLEMFNLTPKNFSTFRIESVIHPNDRKRARQVIGEILKTGEATVADLRTMTHDGRIVPMMATGSRISLDDKYYIVGAAIDISERVRAQHHLEVSQKELRERNKSLQLLNELSTKLHGELDESEIYHTTTELLSGLPGSPMVSFLLYDEESKSINMVSEKNLPGNFDASDIGVPLEACLAGIAFEERQIQAIPDITKDSRQSAELIHTKITTIGAKSEISIPLFSKEKPIGAVSLLFSHKKNFKAMELQSMESMGRTISIAVESARHTKELEFQASHDSLTHLPNRLSLRNELKHVFEQVKQSKSVYTLFLVDLDRFKEVNDTLGHDIGDQLICKIGPRIRDVMLNTNFFLSRLGGDEFALLLQVNDDEAHPCQLAQNIADAIRTPFMIDDIALELGSSIGISVITCQESLSEREVLRRADIAMYKAKLNGEDYALYSPDIDTHSKDKLALMLDLRTALSDEEFILYYQPKLDIQENRVTGFEALIRWQHHEKGLVFPDTFIELVEMSDLIHPMTEQVLKYAMRQIRQWQDQGLNLSVAVNISTRNLLDQDFPTLLERLIKENNINPALLELEITENALITDPNRVKTILAEITSLGITLSIDDFGTGYSSMAYLKDLPIDKLKIDRSFIMDMDSNKQDEVIVTSTVALAHNLGLNVVAEGVETETALKKLAALNCKYAQGYFISRPLPPEQLEEYISNNVK